MTARPVPESSSDGLPADAEVVSRVLGGDLESFGILVDRYQNVFARYAYQMTGTMDDAADVLQESFVRAYRALARCQDPTNFKSWLFTIVCNQCKSHLSRRARRLVVPIDSAATVAAPDDPAGDAASTDLRERVDEILQEFPSDQREALLLKYVEGYSLPEMATILRTSVPALKMRLLRARRRLRERLGGLSA